jgi:hypothetical protein
VVAVGQQEHLLLGFRCLAEDGRALQEVGAWRIGAAARLGGSPAGARTTRGCGGTGTAS